MNSNTIMDSLAQPYLLSCIICDNTYPITDAACIEIGKAFLTTIVKTIYLLRFHIHHQKPIQTTKALKRCVTYLAGWQDDAYIMSRCNKIWMYLGEMFTCQQFKHLHTFQLELTAILQAISIEQPSLDQSSISFANEGSMHLQEISMIETINLIEQDQPPSPQVPAESSFIHNWGQQVDEYLGKIRSYRSEINHLCHMMKLPQINISIVREERYYQIQCSISFECIYLNKKAIYLQGTSIHIQYQKSLQSSCLKLLRRIYITVPEMWKDFVKLKQKKAVIT